MVCLLLALLTGCASLPTEGPVQQVGEGSTRQPGGLDVVPAPPVVDGSPELILAGFLSAVSSGASNRFSIARQYLTPPAAETWNPGAEVRLFTTEIPPITTDSSAVLTGQVVGRLDAQGHYTAMTAQPFTHNFAMTQVDGQWRIADPGNGIWVADSQLASAFQVVGVYYLNHAGVQVVAQNVYLARAEATPTMAIQALLRGPTEWLGPAVMSALPSGTQLTVSSVPVDADGIAQLSFTGELLDLSSDQVAQLAAQVVWTLSAFPAIRGVAITSQGRALSVTGADPQGVVRMDAVRRFAPVTTPGVDAVFAVQNDHVVTLAAQDDWGSPLNGVLGSGWGPLGALSVSADGRQFAVLDQAGSRMWVVASGSDTLPAPLEAVGLVDPQVESSGTTWVIAHPAGGPPTLMKLAPDQTVSAAALEELAGTRVLAFRVSPDHTRIAVVVMDGEGRTTLGLLRFRSLDRMQVDGWRPLVLNTATGELRSIREVGWASDTDLVVLAGLRTVDEQVVWRTDVDAARVESLGPANGSDVVQIAVQPRADGLSAVLRTGGGLGLRYESRSRWVGVGQGLTAITLAG